MTLRSFFRVILCASTLSAWPASAQVDVSSFGARGDGQTDDTRALQTAINSMASGTTLTFGGPSQVYLISSTLIFKPNMTYQGQGTIRMSASTAPHTPVAKLEYNAASQVTFSGVTMDANGVGGGLQLAVDGAASVPANGIQVTSVNFRNTTASPSYGGDGAIYAPVGLTNSLITNNQFVNCPQGTYFANLNNVTISNNYFQGVHAGDAIFVMFTPAPYAYGQGIQIIQNTGQHLGRMGIEIWGNVPTASQSSPITGIVISNNTFSQWDLGYTTYPFGISLVVGTQHSVLNNKLMGPNQGWGIELATPQTTVSQNSISGFSSGIVLNDSSNSVISGNLLTSQNYDGIEFANAPGNRTNEVVQNNSIIDSQNFGILVSTTAWGGATITGNFISRLAGAFPADLGQLFTGISITPPSTPVTINGNSFTQSGVTGPSGFSFIGIRINGGQGSNAQSSYQNNTILSQQLLTQSYGMYGNSTGTMDGAIIQGNTLGGLYAASGGAPSYGSISSGNVVYNCTLTGFLFQ